MAQRAFDQPGQIVAVENDLDRFIGMRRVAACGAGQADLRKARVIVPRNDVVGRFRLGLCLEQDPVARFYLHFGRLRKPALTQRVTIFR